MLPGAKLANALEGAKRPLAVTISFLCHPEIEVRTAEQRSVEITAGGRLLCRVVPPAGYAVRIERGQTSSDGFASCSRAFGHLISTTRLVLAGALGASPVTTQIELSATGNRELAGAGRAETRAAAKHEA